MTSITWAGPRCVQEAAAILGSQNRTQGRCVMYYVCDINLLYAFKFFIIN